MGAVGIGEVWVVCIADENRLLKVEGTGWLPGWWLCVDEKTGYELSVRESWFVARIATAVEA